MAGFYDRFIRPMMFGLDAETAHEIGLKALRISLSTDFAQAKAFERYGRAGSTAVERFGLRFPSVIGVAAGFDKNGVVVDQLASLGFGFVEVGTVTIEPQKGSPKPRLFRLSEDHALINRLGFNNDGAAAVGERLKKIRRRCIVGVNIGRNKDVPNEEATENYLGAFDLVHGVADYITVNVSSPNTPNLRELQKDESLVDLLKALQERNLSRGSKPLLVKIAPDLSQGEIEKIVDVCFRTGVAGIIATNTTTARENLRSGDVGKIGAGGLSGRPLRTRSTGVIREIYRHSKGMMPIIGVGGIFDEHDAFDKLAAGACLLQGYTGFVYVGPSYARDINLKLPELIKQRGFSRIDEVVGSAANI